MENAPPEITMGVNKRKTKEIGFASEVELPEESSYFVLFVCFVQFVDRSLAAKKKLSTNFTKHTNNTKRVELDFCGKAKHIVEPPWPEWADFCIGLRKSLDLGMTAGGFNSFAAISAHHSGSFC
jgi:hypothetical protein